MSETVLDFVLLRSYWVSLSPLNPIFPVMVGLMEPSKSGLGNGCKGRGGDCEWTRVSGTSRDRYRNRPCSVVLCTVNSYVDRNSERCFRFRDRPRLYPDPIFDQSPSSDVLRPFSPIPISSLPHPCSPYPESYGPKVSGQ